MAVYKGNRQILGNFLLVVFICCRFGSKIIFFGVIVEKDDDDDNDDNKPQNEDFYGDASQGFEVKVCEILEYSRAPLTVQDG